MPEKIRIALVGNPNTGKSSLFNALSGASQKTGNFPGITVEKKSGFIHDDDQNLELIDLPGTYSLKANSPDEQLTVDVLQGKIPDETKPEAIIFIFDSLHLKRNLYLYSQVAKLGIPIIGALTMVDLQEPEGLQIDHVKFASELGIPVIDVDPRSSDSIENLRRRLFRHSWELPDTLELPEDSADATMRYQWAGNILKHVESYKKPSNRPLQSFLDKLFTNRITGPISFLGIMFLIFQSIYTWAEPAMDLIESGFSYLGDLAGSSLSGMPILAALVQDGIIGGAGFVLVFVPQIAILFLFISVLEESGYLSRAAFLMDRLLSWSGLSGRSFVPMLSSFACAIPGIMSARVIPDERTRLSTIMVAPFMSCSARLPVYVLLIGAILAPIIGPGYAALALLGMHFLGILYALPTAYILNRKIYKSIDSGFLLEMPRYRMPIFFNVYIRVKNAVWKFIKTAGSVILAFSIIIWAASYFPRGDHHTAQLKAQVEKRVAEMEGTISSEEKKLLIERGTKAALLENSYLGSFGKTVAPLFEPLGFDWRVTVGILGAFPARELIISTLSIIFQADGEEDETLRERLTSAKREDGSRLFTPLTAISIMVFFALCAQCMSTLVTIARETNSNLNAVLVFIYMTSLAYVSSLLVYQGGKLLGFS